MMDIPIKNEHLSTPLAELLLANLCGNTDVVVEAEAFGVLAFSMVAWRSDHGENVLDLAQHYGSTSFDCTACRRKNMQFPAVIAHECLRVRYWRCREDSDAAYFYEDVVLNAWNCRTWSSRNLAVSRASDRAMKIIQACGLDPMKTSRLTLQELDPRICCKTCSRSGVWLVMSWRTAVCLITKRQFSILLIWFLKVDHARTAHGAIDQEEAEWELISGEAVALAKECEENNRESLFQEYYPQLLFSCARCDDPMSNRNTTLPRALDHVRRA